jgi:hypothetical protein
MLLKPLEPNGLVRNGDDAASGELTMPRRDVHKQVVVGGLPMPDVLLVVLDSHALGLGLDALTLGFGLPISLTRGCQIRDV